MTMIAPTLQAFFTERMIKQRGASPQTIASYRDTLRLLLIFARDRTGKPPASLDWDDLDAVMISAFLDHLEQLFRDRNNWYLSAAPELLALAAARQDTAWQAARS